MIIKCDCNRCGRGIEFDWKEAGSIIDCPHCSQKTQLYSPAIRNQPPVAAAFPQNIVRRKAKIKVRYEFFGTGAAVQFSGFICLFFFPIGTALGIFFLILGSELSKRFFCSECRNPVANRSASFCQHCGSSFD
jgi:hypothetical protein